MFNIAFNNCRLLSPEETIKRMFNHTDANGIVRIPIWPWLEQEDLYQQKYFCCTMNWRRLSDCEQVINEYINLYEQLKGIADAYVAHQVKDIKTVVDFLPDDLFLVWKAYLANSHDEVAMVGPGAAEVVRTARQVCSSLMLHFDENRQKKDNSLLAQAMAIHIFGKSFEIERSNRYSCLINIYVDENQYDDNLIDALTFMFARRDFDVLINNPGYNIIDIEMSRMVNCFIEHNLKNSRKEPRECAETLIDFLKNLQLYIKTIKLPYQNQIDKFDLMECVYGSFGFDVFLPEGYSNPQKKSELICLGPDNVHAVVGNDMFTQRVLPAFYYNLIRNGFENDAELIKIDDYLLGFK